MHTYVYRTSKWNGDHGRVVRNIMGGWEEEERLLESICHECRRGSLGSLCHGGRVQVTWYLCSESWEMFLCVCTHSTQFFRRLAELFLATASYSFGLLAFGCTVLFSRFLSVACWVLFTWPWAIPSWMGLWFLFGDFDFSFPLHSPHCSVLSMVMYISALTLPMASFSIFGPLSFSSASRGSPCCLSPILWLKFHILVV